MSKLVRELRRDDAGRLRERIVIEARSGARDVLGQPADDWAEVTRTWARVEWLGSQERRANGQMVESASVRFIIRHRQVPVLRADMRVRWRGQVWRIVGPVQTSEDRAWDVIYAQEVA